MTQNNIYPELEEFGWDGFFIRAYRPLAGSGKIPTRIIGQERNLYRILNQNGEAFATISGHAFFHEMQGDIRPTVGDWVIVRSQPAGEDTVIEAVLSRKTKLSRQVAGGRDRFAGGITDEQVVAANIDTAFIVCSLDTERNTSLRRIERYLTLVWSSGASPVIILNKVDLCPDVDTIVGEVAQIAMGVPIVSISATAKIGMSALQGYLTRGKTAVFLGLSGVGKSSIINALLPENRIKVGDVRQSDFRGRHTTTRRELFLLPGKGMVIDTPGMREIHIWSEESDIYDAFHDIEELSQACRFRDCSHGEEPDCAVQQAISEGTLDRHRFQNYLKLQKETRYQVSRQNGKAALQEKMKWKKISQLQKRYQKDRLD